MEITEQDVTVITLFDNRMYTKDMDLGDFIHSIVYMQRAYEESDTKSKRLKAVWHNRRTNPEALKTNNKPFWLDLTPDRKGFVLNESAETVRRMFDLSINGFGSNLIAKHFNRDGIPSPNVKTWGDAVITKTLNNKAVLGEYQPNTVKGRKYTPIGEPIKGYYPAVVGENTFYLSQAKIKERAKSQRRGSTSSHLNMLKGIGVCVDCGAPLRIQTQQHLKYFRCPEALKGLCNSKPVNIWFLRDWLKEQWLSPVFFETWSVATGESVSKELEALEAKKSELSNTLEMMLQSFSATTSPLVLANIQQRTEEIDSLGKEIESLKEKEASSSQHQVSYQNCWTLIDKAFSEENETENLVARNKIRGLLSRFDSFTVGMTSNREATLAADIDGGIFSFISTPFPYAPKRKAPPFIWYMVEIPSVTKSNV